MDPYLSVLGGRISHYWECLRKEREKVVYLFTPKVYMHHNFCTERNFKPPQQKSSFKTFLTYMGNMKWCLDFMLKRLKLCRFAFMLGESTNGKSILILKEKRNNKVNSKEKNYI